MENLPLILQYLYPDAPFLSYQVGVGDDGIKYISVWDVDVLGPQPTAEAIAAAEPLAVAADALSQAQAQAQADLSASDITVLRLIELNSTFVPADWKAYRTALRTVIGATAADGPQTLPTRPAYPAPGA